MPRTIAEVEEIVKRERERLRSMKPIRNLDVELVLCCEVCGTRVYVRAKTTAAAHDLALAGGWAIVSNVPPVQLCPFENPARIESIAEVLVK